MRLDPAIVARMSLEEQREFARLLNAIDDSPWFPMQPENPDDPPTPQQVAYDSKADVVGYGGAAGGGKTDLGIGMALTKHKVCQIFRREGTELNGVIDRMAEVLGHRAGLAGRPPVWRQPTRTTQVIEFGSVPNLGDERKYQGRAKDFLWLDEAANFLESQARFLMGWVRTTDPTQPTRTLLTFNPPTSAEGQWIVQFFAPWLDDRYKGTPAQPGELRWFATLDGEDTEVESGAVFVHKGEQIRPQSRTFIPSRISDNPFLLDTGYMAQLQSLPEPLRSQMLNGDFRAGIEDDPYQVIPTAWVDQAMSRWRARAPLPVQHSLGVDVAMGGRDSTVIIARCEGDWFEQPVVVKGSDCTSAQVVAARVLERKRNDAVIHIDLFGVGAKPYGELMKLHQQVVGVNVGDPATGVTKEGGVLFNNTRSMLWWRLREALDPSSNRGVALPPDSRLRADLCAPVFELRSNKIAVEDRKSLVKRIGRSPDFGSALGLALIDTPKRHVARALLAGRRYPLRAGGGLMASGHDPYHDI